MFYINPRGRSLVCHAYSSETKALLGVCFCCAWCMGLHAETLRSCRVYTLLLMGCVSHSWKLTWQSPVLYILLFSSYLFPIFPPKKKSDVEKAESARAELDEFIRVHGEIPSQLSDLSQSRAIYSKLRRLKLLHLLKQEESHVAICKATDTFFQKHSRLPKRQNPDTDERRAEDAIGATLGSSVGTESLTGRCSTDYL